MKKNFFKGIVISIVAQFVKLFPMWAIKHTLKSNHYAPYFCLSHKKEMEVLRRIYNTTQNIDDLKWLSLHVWRVDTRIACLKDSKLWQIFIDDICNSYEFKAAYNNVYDKAIAACTKYTLSKDEVVKVCEHDAVNIKLLLKKQPESFTPDVVKNLRPCTRACVFHELLVAVDREKLQTLDTILYQDSSSGWEDVAKIAKGCLSLLLCWEKYVPNLEPKQLVALSDYATWERNGNPVVVASKMAEYWRQGCNFEKIANFAQKLAKKEAIDAINAAKRLVEMLPGGELKMKTLKTLIKHDIAMPKYLGYFFKAGDMTALDNNLALCQDQHVVSYIPRWDIEILSKKYQEKILIALTAENKLSQELFDKASPEIKAKLFDILEENAQRRWFQTRISYIPVPSDVDKIKTWRKISATAQEMSFSYPVWTMVFVENQFYDEKHILKLMQRGDKDAIAAFAQKNGLTQEQYTALLFGPRAALAPQLEMYLKK